MPSIEVGPVGLHVSDEITQERAHIPGVGKVEGRSVFGLAIADHGLELEVRYFTTPDGKAIVDCPSIDDSPEQFERLERGARIGVHPMADPSVLAIKQLRVLRYDPSMQWGNPTLTTLPELDSLAGESVEALFEDNGALRVGTRSEVLGERGQDIALVWERGDNPVLPLIAYVLTRVVPIYNTIEENE